MRYLAIILLSITFFRMYSQSPGCPQITPVGATVCQGQTANLTATAIENYNTTSYSVSSIPYTPFPYSGGTGVSVGTDDVWSPVINLGFNFCFFGNPFSQVILGSNGQICFNTASAGGYDSYPVNTTLPSSGNTPGNTINVFRDIDPSVSGSNVSYYIGGSAPCRYLVFYFNNVALYSCTTPRSTFQMVLYENTNFIDIYIGNSSGSCGWQSGNGIVGIQNAAATVAYTPPGRNGTNWTAVNEAWRFAPTGAPSSAITWYGPGNVVVGTGLGPVGVTPLTNTTYTSSMVITNCNGAQTTYTNSCLVTVNPSPSVTVTGSNISCSSPTAVLSATATSGSYNWSGPGIVAGGATSSPTVNLAGTYVLTVSASGCFTTTSISITGATPPSVASSVNGVLNCSLTSVNASATTTSSPVSYNWSGPGITSGAGTGTIAVNQSGTYDYTVTNTSNGCTTTGSQVVNQNTTTPTVNAGPTQTLNCGVPSVTLTGTASSGAIINWVGGVCGASNSLTTTACSAGSYSLVVTDPTSACTNTSVVNVVSSSTNVPQATVNAVTNTITCTNTIVAIGVTLSNSDPVTYSWAGPNVTGPTNTPTTTAGTGGNYNVTITNTVTSCQSIFAVFVPSNTTPVPANVATPSTITCLSNTTTLLATPTGTNYTYSWFGPGTIQNGTTNNPTVNAGGNFLVTITNTDNGCIGNFTVTVPTDNAAPVLNLSGNSYTTTCTTPTVQLGATSNIDPNTTYLWTPTLGGTLNNNSINNPIASSGGLYSVVVTNTLNGCVSAPQTVTVTSDANIPTYTLSASTVSLTCSAAVQTLTLNTSASNLTYTWSPAPSSGVNSINPTFNTVGVYTCVITNTLNSCFSVAQVTVGTNTSIPAITITPSTSLTCSSLSVSITSTTTPSTGVSFNWTGAGIIGSSSGSSINVNTAGNYNVIFTDAANGCTNTAVTSVGSNTTPPLLSVSSTGTVLSCAVTSITLNASTNALNAPTWVTPSGASANPVTVVTSGNYVSTIVDASNGCSASQTVVVTGNTTPPTANALNAVIPCGNSSIVLNGSSSSNSVTYSWAGPNSGSIISGANTANPSVSDAGVYTLTVTNTINGCSSSTLITVSQSTISASFNANPTAGISPLLVNFTNTSTGAISTYNWYFGDGNIATTQNANNTYTVNGIYTATLVITAGSCVSKATIDIVVNDPLDLEIPNVFTPNGDGKNDIFRIKATGAKKVALQIFNRWGLKLFDYEGDDAFWNGSTPSGSTASDGTYFYFVKATGFDDATVEKRGSLSLFK